MLERTGKQGILLQLQLLAPLSNPFLQSCPLTGGKECLELLATQICRTVERPDSAPLSSGSLDTINCNSGPAFHLAFSNWVSESPSLSMESRLQWSISSFPSSPSSPSNASIMLMIRSCLALTWWSKKQVMQLSQCYLLWLSRSCFHLNLWSLAQLHHSAALLFLLRRAALHFLLRFPARNGSC